MEFLWSTKRRRVLKAQELEIKRYEVFPKRYKHDVSQSIPKVLSKNDAFLIAHAQIRTGK